MSPQSERRNESRRPDEESVPRDHFLYISPETHRLVDARTDKAIALIQQQRAARVLRREQNR